MPAKITLQDSYERILMEKNEEITRLKSENEQLRNLLQKEIDYADGRIEQIRELLEK